MEQPGVTLEGALGRTESDIDAALKAAAATVAQLKRAKKAVSVGALRDLERALEGAEQLSSAFRDSLRAARAAWNFDDKSYLESGAFVEELLATGRARGVRVNELDGQVVSYPSLVRILANDGAVEIDRKRHKGIRPSVLVETLRVNQERPVKFRPAAFIEALAQAYELERVSQGKEAGGVVTLVDVYRVLTMLPGQTSAYSKQEFIRDIYLLDESGVGATKDGLRMTLPASTGARTANTLATVMRNGELKIYYGIAFR